MHHADAGLAVFHGFEEVLVVVVAVLLLLAFQTLLGVALPVNGFGW